MAPQSITLSKETYYSWHLSLRVDRPVEGCTMRPHAYMYGKKLDDRDLDKPLQPHSKRCREPPPHHEFSYRWFRGPPVDPCAYEGCPRRTSFSPHDWSIHALGGSDCSLQCVSTQSSLYKRTFCNSSCFVSGWKTQYTVPRDRRGGNNGTSTPVNGRSYSGGTGNVDDDARSVGSAGSFGHQQGAYPHHNGGRRHLYNNSDDGSIMSSTSGNNNGHNPGTPRGYPGASGFGNEFSEDVQQQDEWMEISRDQLFIPTTDDVGRKLKLEAAAYSAETGELLMLRVVKTDIVLSRAPDPVKRNLLTAKGGGPSGGARFRIASYNVLAEIYATQQQYPYCDFWALSWDYR